MDKNKAIEKIEALFSVYKTLEQADTTHLQGLDKGKLYELYVLSELICDLKQRGCKLLFQGSSIVFKAAAGKIKAADPHFVVTAPDRSTSRIFVDIEFDTMGTSHPWFASRARPDLSSRHELDLVVVNTRSPYPSFEEVLLGVECKSQARFDKKVVKEALGIRRELSILVPAEPSRLSKAGASPVLKVPAKPASEFWLAYDDPKGNDYRASPKAFGIEFRHIPLP